MDISSYVHVLNGRLRIKVSEIKRSAEKASQVEEIIRVLAGVISATANPITGNVLVFYHSHLLTPLAIIGALQDADFLRTPVLEQPLSTTSRSFMEMIGHAVATSAAEALMQRAILALL